MRKYMPYGITQYYLPPDSSDFPVFTHAEQVVELASPWVQGWVDLGDGYIPRYFFRQDGHLSQK